jgi:hypothetical protein
MTALRLLSVVQLAAACVLLPTVVTAQYALYRLLSSRTPISSSTEEAVLVAGDVLWDR